MTEDAGPDLAPDLSGSPLRVNRVQPAYQQVADQLRDRILDGSLSTGDRLPTEVELSEIFGVSRSTVREALRLLASRGLIRTTRGTTGGTFVARVEFGQVSDYLEVSLGLMSGAADITIAHLLEAREAFEVPAAGLAALRHEERHIAELRESVEREKVSRTRGHALPRAPHVPRHRPRRHRQPAHRRDDRAVVQRAAGTPGR